MKLGLLTDSVGRLDLPQALDLAAELELDAVELATGNWSLAPHVDLSKLIESAAARAELLGQVESRGLSICALNANGNSLHPVVGGEHDRVVRDTIQLAADLGVPTVVMMSGLPAGAAGERTPNWVTTSWPPETQDILAYQWNEVAIPYWEDLAEFARQRNVRIAVEMHGKQLVFNPATLLQLREHVDPTVVGANLDPSHLMWMGADILEVVQRLGDAIFHVHAKDVRIERRNAGPNGVLDALPPEHAAKRSWNFVTLGLGHPGGAAFWADFVYALRGVGYDGPLSIEHEDLLVGSEEGVRRAAAVLQAAVLRDAPDWKPAQI